MAVRRNATRRRPGEAARFSWAVAIVRQRRFPVSSSAPHGRCSVDCSISATRARQPFGQAMRTLALPDRGNRSPNAAIRTGHPLTSPAGRGASTSTSVTCRAPAHEKLWKAALVPSKPSRLVRPAPGVLIVRAMPPPRGTRRGAVKVSKTARPATTPAPPAGRVKSTDGSVAPGGQAKSPSTVDFSSVPSAATAIESASPSATRRSAPVVTSRTVASPPDCTARNGSAYARASAAAVRPVGVTVPSAATVTAPVGRQPASAKPCVPAAMRGVVLAHVQDRSLGAVVAAHDDVRAHRDQVGGAVGGERDVGRLRRAVRDLQQHVVGARREVQVADHDRLGRRTARARRRARARPRRRSPRKSSLYGSDTVLAFAAGASASGRRVRRRGTILIGSPAPSGGSAARGGSALPPRATRAARA